MRWPIRLLHLRYFCSCPNLNLFGQGHQLQIDGRPANNHPNLHVFIQEQSLHIVFVKECAIVIQRELKHVLLLCVIFASQVGSASFL